MESEVDDIFKSFVSSKLKQLGMSGGSSEDLEKSLQKSALHKLPVDDKVDSSKEAKMRFEANEDDKQTKSKKDKKHKKHKKEKKMKKQKKAKEKDKDKSNKTNDKRKKSASPDVSANNCFKKIVSKDDAEDMIKCKSVTSYYETVTKMKQIEKLSLKVEKPQSESNVIENNKVSTTVSLSIESTEMEYVDETSTITPLNEKSSSHSLTNEGKENTNGALSSTDVILLKNTSDTVPNSQQDNASKTVSPKLNEKIDTASKTTTNDKTIKEKSHSPKHRKRSRSHKSRSRSPSRKRSKHSHSRHRSRSPKRHKHHHHHHHKSSRSSDRRHKSSRRRRSPSPLISSRDKMKLLEIAKANVLAQHKAGVTATSLSSESKAMLRCGGVTLKQLTGVCQDIAEGKREVLANITASIEAKPSKVHHPFQVREAQPISINIKNALPPIPPKPITELTKEFPVSCGSQHQRKEVLEEVYGKWEPIVKDAEAKSSLQAIIEEKVFPDAPVDDNTMSITEVIAQRVNAVRELQSNPNDFKAVKNMMVSQNKLDNWTASKVIPGRFTGSTSLQPLARSELERGGQQAWVNQKALNSDKQVGGIGRSLLQKMGWKEGESLGKNNFGMVEPIKVQVKTDRKGLSSVMEMPAAPALPKVPKNNHMVLKDLSGKHPVSAIMEICSKRRWKPPDFQLVRNNGPDHHRTFMFKVMVNGVYYQPSLSSVNKKQAKAHAAAAALQALGLVSS